MTRVDLLQLDHFVGIIRPCRSGVLFSNQTGGNACAHPEVEGVFIPLPLWIFNEAKDPLENVWRDSRPEVSYARLHSFLESQPYLAHLFRIPPWQDLQSLHWGEAWVPLIIQPSPEKPISREVWEERVPWEAQALLRPFAGELVYLTYPNSD